LFSQNGGTPSATVTRQAVTFKPLAYIRPWPVKDTLECPSHIPPGRNRGGYLTDRATLSLSVLIPTSFISASSDPVYSHRTRGRKSRTGCIPGPTLISGLLNKRSCKGGSNLKTCIGFRQLDDLFCKFLGLTPICK